ncbi:hypothetical protein SpiGrapes_0135 [Sphaerochaeta pleomorpha str. Grapes]|uniref:DUF5723 domain-containing protein n=1 Tax=Sphaerochaeta pleomorpha (strain ATCC BAA-1885 / DSM 22778 / Grapes) TaxID=158190 RepID=G8QTN4_SPHPG|nr:hypothetical protein [Sphaerochaeta pleomorpha]AEV27999.1 hypothetical protein SpiGrapes_0135 [Sphaerochaeta pleomorpha str. Grapes]
MHKRFLLVLITFLSACITLSAGSTIDLGESDLQGSLSGILEGTATSDGSFSLSLTPDFVVGNFAFQLDLKIKGTFETDPITLDFDFSGWKPPLKEDGQSQSEFVISVLKQYSSFIRYAQWGQRYDKLYLRYGKLSGITIGDGALINGFFDTSVSVRMAKPGLDIMLDGMLLGIPFTGFEFLTNDIFEPTLLSWRIFARPLYTSTSKSLFSELETGVSFASNPSSIYTTTYADDSALVSESRRLISIDMGIPILTWESLKMVFFSDLLLQSPDGIATQPGVATRYGIWGHWKSLFIFNTSITVPHFGIYYADYFDTGFESKTYAELKDSIVAIGTNRLDAQFALNFASKGAYFTTRLRSDYANGAYSNYRFLATARIDKRLLNIVSLDLSYEKLYPTSTGEAFFDGLSTLRNVEIGATTVINVKPYSFDIGLSMVFDEEANSTLEVETAVRISIL